MDIADKIQTIVVELHKAVERQDAEIKKFGEPTAEIRAHIGNLDTHYNELKAAQDALEVKFQRMTVPSPSPADARTEENKACKAAFYKFIRGGKETLAPEERKALVEDTVGQYLIEPELDAEIVRTLPKITIVRGLSTIRAIGKDRIKMRSMGEVSVGWGKLETGAEIHETDMTPGAPTYQYVEDLYALAKIGEDELMDSDVALEPLLADSFSRAIGESEDEKFIKGAGHASNEPEGITKNTTLIADTKTTTAVDAVIIEDFLGMIYACPSQYRRNGVFVMNSATELAIRKLREKDSSGSYEGGFLWQPSVQLGLPNTFLGRPVYTQDDIKTLADTAQVIAIFGDFKAGYRIIDRVGMTLQRLTELYSEAGLVGFKIHARVGGSVMRASQKPLVLLTEKA